MSAGARDTLPMNIIRQRKNGETNENVGTTADRFRDRFDGKDASADGRKGETTTTMVNEYYDLVTDFYEFGWGQNFHFAPRYVGESFYESLARHEYFLALKAGFKPGDRVLDLGCGVGGPARNIVRFSRCQVMGVNNNEYQISRARRHDKRLGFEQNIDYTKTDFCNMPFADNSYDGAYGIEATCHAADRVKLFTELFRVLKPGACFVVYEWVTTKKYDPASEEHRRIVHGIELGDGLPELATGQDVLDALTKSGFQVEEEYDVIEEFENGHIHNIPWYQPLLGNYSSLFGLKSTPLGRKITNVMCRVLEFLRIAPAGTYKSTEILEEAAANLAIGGKKQIFTPSYYVKARKPVA